jgi:hypothetical protein
MLGLPLAFAAPLVLAGLAALPALWWLLRVTPPRPRTIPFPPLRLVLDLLPEREKAARTPWWILLLRIAIAAFVILAAAGPIWNPSRVDATTGRTPLVLLADNGWASAPDWEERRAVLERLVREAGSTARPVVLMATGDRPASAVPTDSGAALERLRALSPVPFTPSRAPALAAAADFLARNETADFVWISDATSIGEETVPQSLRTALGRRSATVMTDEDPVLGLAGVENGAAGASVRIVRTGEGPSVGRLRALDFKGRLLAEKDFVLSGPEGRVDFSLPLELRNEIARFDVLGLRSAGATALLDETYRRRRVGIVSGVTADVSQPLLSPIYYVQRALEPFAEVRVPRQGTIDSIGGLLDEKASMLILADVGALPDDVRRRVEAFVNEGGVLLRFAGPRLAAGGDELVPVKLRRGGRSLGGALAWETPRTLGPFDAASPFHGIDQPKDVAVGRQLLAEPEPDLARKTWASLVDGTPIVTADRRGAGLVILVHVTADTSWSNLPLSGLFVDMLKRVVALAGSSVGGQEPNAAAGRTVAPFITLDGYGAPGIPPPTARPIPLGPTLVASGDHPAGWYGDREAPTAVNVLPPDAVLRRLDFSRLGARMEPLRQDPPVDLRPWLLTAAALLFALDTLIAAALAGGLRASFRARTAVLLIVLAAVSSGPDAASAQTTGARDVPPPIGLKERDAASATRFAYVLTGDASVDETSRAGLAGLNAYLSARTALEPGEPVGVDPARDELALYPIIYWPMVAGRDPPGPAAVRAVDAFMKNGGTVIFDTRDAGTALGGNSITPETRLLRRILAGMAVPDLEPIPADHVVTKAFYLLETFPGRFAEGKTYIEALPRGEGPDAERPARAGDGVSPIIITSNDWASAWAIGARGEPLNPVVQQMPRQREMSLRAGVNIAMYALTGNYKADQVHVPALLERLGQ